MPRPTASKDRYTVGVMIAAGVTNPAEIARKLKWPLVRVEAALAGSPQTPRPYRRGQQPLSFVVQRERQRRSAGN